METKHRLPYWLVHDAAPELQEACEKDPATSEDAEWIVHLLHHDGHTTFEANRSVLDNVFANPRLNSPCNRLSLVVGNLL